MTDTQRSLTRAEERLWTSHQLHADAPHGNMAFLVSVHGTLDPVRFIEAVRCVASSEEALHSTISVDSRGRPIMAASTPPETERMKLHADDVASWSRERVRRPLDPRGPAWESVLVDCGDGEWAWWFNAHHILIDATGSANLWAAVVDEYHSTERTNVSAAQNRSLVEASNSSARAQRAFEHWDAWDTSVEQVLYRRPGSPTTSAERLTIDVDEHDLGPLVENPRFAMVGVDLTYLTLMATTTAAWLRLVTGRDQIVLGIPVHHRSGRARTVIGLCMELYPVVVDVEPDDDLVSLHQRVCDAILFTLRRAHPGSSPRQEFDAVVNTFSARFEPFGDLEVGAVWVHSGHVDPHHSIRVQFADTGAGHELLVDVNAGVADEPHRRRIPAHLRTIVDTFRTNPSTRIDGIDLRTTDEREVLAAFNRTPHTPATGSIVEATATALRATDAVVLVDGDRRFDATQVERAIAVTASALRGSEIGAGDRVAVCMPRGAELAIAIHAVWRAGASLVPIDPDHPPARREHIIEHSGASLVLDRLPDATALEPGPAVESDQPSPALDDEAYVLYTSGSSGLPKGVPIAHRGLAEYAAVAVDRYGDGTTSMPLFTSIGFDLTITSLIVPWLTGGALLTHRGDAVSALREIVHDPTPQTVKCTPSHLELLVRLADGPCGIHTLVIGGEAFTRDLADRTHSVLGSSVTVINEYGPTEAVVGCMIHTHTATDSGPDVPIGRPQPGVELRIVRGDTDVVIGSPGELLVRRPGLTHGYLGADDETSKVFLPAADGAPWYRTGDLVRMLDDQTMVYLGRIDDQLKVGGVRIEPAEIEAVLTAHEDVAQAVVRLWRPSEPTSPQRCVRCGLASSVPDAHFDDEGVCQTCLHYERVASQAERYWGDSEVLRAEIAGARSRRTGEFDLLHLLSGGKDSTYALYQLVELGADVHCLTLDNGFISDGALANVAATAADLGVSHEIVTVNAMNEIFRDSLERWSNVCNGCYKTIYTLGIVRADELGIPAVVTGLSRGQLFETRLTPEQFEADRFDPARIDETVLAARKHYHRTEDAVTRALVTDLFDDDRVFERISFLDFYRYVDVSLEEMLSFLDTRAPWVRPDDTGRSTNCLINDAGISVHLRERGFHNYAQPYSWDVRLGHKTRDEAIAELDDELDESRVADMLAEVDYTPRSRDALTAWVVPSIGRSIDVSELRTHLGDRIPSGVVPRAFVEVESLPMTANGKVDVNSLPQPTRHAADLGAYRPPSDQVEEVLAELWAELLGIERAGIDDDFFDLGGSSLLALQLAIRVDEAFGIHVPESEFFSRRTIAAMASLIRECTPSEREDRTAHPIPRQPTVLGDIPPLTAPQQALIDATVMDGGARYLVTKRFDIVGPLDVDSFVANLRSAVGRHEALHTTLVGERRRLEAEQALAVRRSQMHGVDDGKIDAISEALARTPIDLEHGPLVRLELIERTADHHHLLLTLHHAAADEHSLDVLWDELVAPVTEHAEPEVRYRDVVAWNQSTPEQLARVVGRSTMTEPTTLPVSRPREPGPDGYVRVRSELDFAHLRDRPAVVATAGLTVALGRLGGHEAVQVGLVASQRVHPQAATTIGYLLNTVPLTVDIDLGLTLEQHLHEVERHVGEALGDVVVDLTSVVESGGSPPRILLVISDEKNPRLPGADVRARVIHNGTAVSDATFFVHLTERGTELSVEYAGNRIDEPAARAMLRSWDLAMAACVDDTSATIGTTPLREDATSWLTTPPPPPIDLIGLISGRLESAPNADVIVCDSNRLDGASFDDRSRRIAAGLRSCGVEPGHRVGLVMARSVDAIASIWAVLRLGASYVPIDREHPPDRIRACLEAADVGVLLHDLARTDAVPSAMHSLTIDDALDHEPDRTPPSDHRGEAYVIFTSGSEGTPKGVPVHHEQLNASTAARLAYYDTPVDSFLLVSSLGFDSSVAGLFWTLATGGTLVMPTDAEAHDVDQLVNLVERHQISHTLMVPSLWRALLERGGQRLRALSQVVVAGEATTTALVQDHFELLDARLDNEYGPTEATVWATAAELRPDRELVPIGVPIPGVAVLIVDDAGLPVPDGLPGELVISGPTVVDGYIDGVHADAFAPVDPAYVPSYRTGDVVREVNGELEFLGRVDDQLSLGGYRIEPAEIEAALMAYEGVDQAAVVLRRDLPEGALTELAAFEPDQAADLFRRAAGQADPFGALEALVATELGVKARLVAYVNVNGVDLDGLERHVRSRLPAAAVPTRIELVPSMPTTPNGKVDRIALHNRPTPERPRPVTTSALTSDLSVHQMLGVWRTVFGRNDIGPDDDFFDLGGDSLLAVALLSTIARELDWESSVSAVLEHRTPRKLARSRDGEPTSSRLATLLRPGGDGPPLVILPPSGGNVMGYRQFVDHLAGDRVVVGMRAPGADGLESPATTVQAAVERWLPEVVDAFGYGPLHVLGWSTGGIMAYELGRQLDAAGVAVHSVVMLDTVHPDHRSVVIGTERSDRYRELLRSHNVRGVGAEAVHVLRKRLNPYRWRLQWRQRRGTDRPLDPILVEAWQMETANAAVGAYEPEAPPPGLTLVVASSSDAVQVAEPWKRLASNLEIVLVPGAHAGPDSIMEPHRAATTAAAVGALLSRRDG